MIIATFNVNSIRARMEILARWILDRKPDIVCLQETKVTDAEFPAGEFVKIGYRCLFRGEKSYNGVAIASRLEPDEVGYGFDGSGEDEGTRLISIRVANMHVVNTYVPQGTSPDSDRFQYKLAFFERIRAYFEGRFRPDDRIIWVGDFNVAPEPIDVHDPKRLLGHVGYHPEEHRALARVKAWGFTDIFRLHRPEAGQYTFWDYRVRDAVSRGLGWRVDHIWGTEPMAKLSTEAWIDRDVRLWERPSDHAPMAAVFSV